MAIVARSGGVPLKVTIPFTVAAVAGSTAFPVGADGSPALGVAASVFEGAAPPPPPLGVAAVEVGGFSLLQAKARRAASRRIG